MDASRSIPSYGLRRDIYLTLSVEAFPVRALVEFGYSLPFGYATNICLDGHRLSHGAKVAACSKLAASNANYVVIKPIVHFFSEATVTFASSITTLSDPFSYKFPIDCTHSSLCQRSSAPSRWYTSNEPGR